MIPKQKAKQLIMQMYKHQWREGNEEWQAAKVCAIICVEEIINQLSEIHLMVSAVLRSTHPISEEIALKYEYWQSVKQIIQQQ